MYYKDWALFFCVPNSYLIHFLKSFWVLNKNRKAIESVLSDDLYIYKLLNPLRRYYLRRFYWDVANKYIPIIRILSFITPLDKIDPFQHATYLHLNPSTFLFFFTIFIYKYVLFYRFYKVLFKYQATVEVNLTAALYKEKCRPKINECKAYYILMCVIVKVNTFIS